MKTNLPSPFREAFEHNDAILTNETSRKVFLDMVCNGAVKLYGFTAFIKENGILRTYSYQEGVCKKFSDEGVWFECEVPYVQWED